MDEVRMRTAVSCALRKAQMRFLRQIVNALGGKPANWRREELCIIGHFNFLRNFCLRQFGGVQNMRLVLDEGPLERPFRAIDINALPVLPGSIEERAINARAEIGVLEFNMRALDGKRRAIVFYQVFSD